MTVVTAENLSERDIFLFAVCVKCPRDSESKSSRGETHRHQLTAVQRQTEGFADPQNFLAVRFTEGCVPRPGGIHVVGRVANDQRLAFSAAEVGSMLRLRKTRANVSSRSERNSS